MYQPNHYAKTRIQIRRNRIRMAAHLISNTAQAVDKTTDTAGLMNHWIHSLNKRLYYMTEWMKNRFRVKTNLRVSSTYSDQEMGYVAKYINYLASGMKFISEVAGKFAGK